MSVERRLLLFLVAALVTLAGAMALVVGAQRSAAGDAADRQAAATGVLTAVFDLDVALRGYLLTGHVADLRPYRETQERYAQALTAARRAVGTDRSSRRPLEAAATQMRAWQAEAATRIADVARRGARSIDIRNGVLRRNRLSEAREQLHALDLRLQARRADELDAAETMAIAVLILLVLALGGTGYALIRRGSRLRERMLAGELAFRESQREFTDVLQAITVERDAAAVLQRHLERSIDGGAVTVLLPDVTGRRLEAAAGTAAAGELERAEPRDCVALRTAHPHHGGDGDPGLLTCRICGQLPGRSDCRPLLAGGRAVGAVLAAHPAPLSADEERAFTESTARAAPLLANLRAIAVAESHAATDALTGLPNRRTLDATLQRMAAQASRSVQPLAAIVLDIDWFKTINDRYGHDIGDDVLAAIAGTLRAGVRDSDVAGRLGGEEFVVLAPDTGIEGAETLAEKLREAIALTEVPGVDEVITASFGVAVLPDDAATPEQLMRRADRALYLAKELGRNRVALGRSLPD